MVTITYKQILGECKMKKALLVSALVSSVLFGQEILYPDRMKNMAEMETAMSEIQKGFLYDNVNVVRNGVKHLKVTIAHTESFIKEGVNEEGFNSLVYAKKQAVDIGKLADEILLTFEQGDRYNAANSYLKVLSKCLTCHQTVRSW
jgi:cytochrome c556